MEAEQRYELHTHVKENLINEVHSNIKQWQRDNYHKVGICMVINRMHWGRWEKERRYIRKKGKQSWLDCTVHGFHICFTYIY